MYEPDAGLAGDHRVDLSGIASDLMGYLRNCDRSKDYRSKDFSLSPQTNE